MTETTESVVIIPSEALEGSAPSTEQPAKPVTLQVRTPPKRNRVDLDRGNGRQWTPPPTARELTAAHWLHRYGGPVGRRGFQQWIKRADLQSLN